MNNYLNQLCCLSGLLILLFHAELTAGTGSVWEISGTPNLRFTYDRSGHIVSAVTVGVSSNVYMYSNRGVLTNEIRYVTGDLSPTHIQRTYDNRGRASVFSLNDELTVSYQYDNEGRVSGIGVQQGNVTVTNVYGYQPGVTIPLQKQTDQILVSKKYWFGRGFVTSVSNFISETLVSSFDYEADKICRYTQRTDCGVDTNRFTYNARSELVAAHMGGADYTYGYDSIGNRLFSSHNGLTNTYTVNNLNQYTSIACPQPGSSYTLSYDADGNMTSDGEWNCTYDAENRPRIFTPVIPTNGARRVAFMYDHNGCQIMRRVSILTPSSGTNDGANVWLPLKTSYWVWDGLVPVRKMTVNEQTQTTNFIYYVWGVDLSGTLGGLGGVDGLLVEIRDGVAYYPCYDGNGNVTEYVDGNGNVHARYRYNAFGGIVSGSGDLADTFDFRFSTKWYDDVTGLYNFVYRFYHPQLGRWLTRDPLQEQSSINLYLFIRNNPVSKIDCLGLFDVPNTWYAQLNNRAKMLGLSGQSLSAYIILVYMQIRAWAGDDPWIPQFMFNYLFGSGQPITLTKADVKSISKHAISPDLINFHRENDFGFFKHERFIPVTTSRFQFRVMDYGPGNLTLGTFSIEYKGQVSNCKFTGMFRVYDRFDFNWSIRDNTFAEYQLRLFTFLTTGIPFPVFSEWIPVEQDRKDGMAKWR